MDTKKIENIYKIYSNALILSVSFLISFFSSLLVLGTASNLSYLNDIKYTFEVSEILIPKFTIVSFLISIVSFGITIIIVWLVGIYKCSKVEKKYKDQIYTWVLLGSIIFPVSYILILLKINSILKNIELEKLNNTELINKS